MTTINVITSGSLGNHFYSQQLSSVLMSSGTDKIRQSLSGNVLENVLVDSQEYSTVHSVEYLFKYSKTYGCLMGTMCSL